MNVGLIDEIIIPGSSQNSLEKVGDFLATPGRLFFGRSYILTEEGILQSPEIFSTLGRLIAKIAIFALLPLSLISSLVGLGLKTLAHRIDPQLKEKYSLPTLLNARSEVNFRGELPPNPWTPNCVNSQQRSFWGALYQADPIAIPETLFDPIGVLKTVLSSSNHKFLQSQNITLLEEKENYLHYAYEVNIPSGPLKGTYIDDVDIFYDQAQHCFQIRSASRTGFRDAIHLDFSKPGANKNRIEAIREVFSEAAKSLTKDL